jgi:predicted permease
MQMVMPVGGFLTLGFVIAGFPLKELFVNTKMYVVSLVRLIAIPGAVCLALHALGAGKEIMTLALIFFGTPLGLNSIVYPEAYGGDVKAGASMASVSHVLSVVTIPLMYLLFIEFL